ncbi:hypothetical protein D3C80_1568000 [compost metagenome]
MRGKRMFGFAVNTVKLFIKEGFTASVHFIIPWVFKTFQFKTHGRKHTNTLLNIRIILYFDNPYLIVALVGYKKFP